MKFLAAFILLASVAFANPALPERIALSEFKEESYFRSFGQYLQKEDGEFTREFGRALVVKSADFFELAFYRKEEGAYVRVGAVLEIRGTGSPHVGAMNDLGVPCISAQKKDGSGKWNAYVLKGKVITSETK
jgi:hypothetical protein